jgi:putative colanic acid biosynthesis UDP-glucose lipid carrier transferase
MISDRRRGIQHLVLLSQCILVTLAFWSWFFLCYHLPIDHAAIGRYLIYNEFVLLGLLIGSGPLRVDAGLHTPSFEEINRRSFRQLGTTLFYLLLYLVAAHDAHISRLFFFTFIPLLYLVLYATNRFLPAPLGHLIFRRALQQKVLLMGPRRKAVQLKRWLEENQHLGLEVLGLLTENADDDTSASLPTLGRPEELEKILAAPGVMQVIMVEFPRTNGSVQHYTNLCEGRGIRLLVVADLDEIFGHPLAVFEDQGMFFIGLREEPLENPINRFLKRCVDVAVSLPVVLFILPPLLLFAWICQRLQSPGPLFFVQPREGFHNEPFPILKLRTMRVGNPGNDALPDSKDDPRLYPIGSFMRKTSLDEMPQFWNVLRGHMSVVGPRPHLRSYNQQYRRVFFPAYVRSFVKPGITGLAQARGFRGDAGTPEDVVHRMGSDIEYLENWSLWLDFWLVFRTGLQMFCPAKGAV